ncbi:putative nuclease HARBI1 [Cucumis melo var. makuwa]|uniref:Nuclease HARBI1 n=1 Tax=Cucumis melo var. makuwa TaxID=1194695 RepID=A0A5D3DL20_CUCMM|nr:putative nuclease HARBI1 [Cucumis melo var. makuwa]TYK24323.1 putative nuclease HARBI1 [Cucumis melo var. makuwa]
MDRQAFSILCLLLRTVTSRLSIEIVDVEEMAALFLHVLTFDMKNRVIQREFFRSSEIVSHHFNSLLLVVIRLHDELLKKPQPVTNTCTYPRWKCFEVRLFDVICDFTFVLASWEGFAVHPLILRDSISCPNGLQVPKGFYNLCVAEYPNAKEFLAPYRQRYHLQEWHGAKNAPITDKEYFNMKHASARNVIERAFNLLKG